MYAHTVLVLLAATAISIRAENAGIFYPFGTGQGDSVAVSSDDDPSQVNVNIETGFPFMKINQSTVFVSIEWLYSTILEGCVGFTYCTLKADQY